MRVHIFKYCLLLLVLSFSILNEFEKNILARVSTLRLIKYYHMLSNDSADLAGDVHALESFVLGAVVEDGWPAAAVSCSVMSCL